MNFLAHIYLSGNDHERMVGNFIADSVKGKVFETFPEGIKNGIKLHRQIDLFTDTHPVIEKGKEMLRPKFRKFAGVVMDIFGDHFLARNWQDYSDQGLDLYTSAVYRILENNQEIFPERARITLHYMQKQNWLYNYQYIEGIKRALTGMAHRSTFESGMENAHIELERNYLFYQNIFHEFLPDLIRFVHKDEHLDLKKLLLS
jgi:acyl carrier protein phosphodiesterase